MAKAIAQVSLEREGALPENTVVNTWHFESDDPTPGSVVDGDFGDYADGLLDRLEEFYTAIQGVLGNTLTGNGVIKLYNWNDAEPRVPRHTRTFTFTPASNPMPCELAVCLSFKAEAASGVNMARRRGRVYLGPLAGEILQQPADSPDVRVHPTYRTAIVNAAVDLATGAVGGSFRMAIFSPTTKLTGGSDDAAWNDVHEFWIDDAFDIQRRRGAAPTTRTTAVVSG